MEATGHLNPLVDFIVKLGGGALVGALGGALITSLLNLRSLSRRQLVQWKEEKYSSLIQLMAAFYYRPASLADAEMLARYERLEKEKPTKGRAWLLNIMHARMDELWLYGSDAVVKACRELDDTPDDDPVRKVTAVGALVLTMRKDLGVKSRLKHKDWHPIYSSPKDEGQPRGPSPSHA